MRSRYKEVFQSIFEEIDNLSAEVFQRFIHIMKLACKMSGEDESKASDKPEKVPALTRIE